MTTPDAPDLESSGLTIADHLELWDDYARDALHAAICFHGVATTNAAKPIADWAAQVADEMLIQRAARKVAHKDAKDAEREAAKKAKK